MSDKIAEWVEKLATGKKARIFWATIIALVIMLVILYPFIDANFFFYGRVETRIDNLEKLVSISGTPVTDDPSLHAEYQDILQDMETARNNSIITVSFDSPRRTHTNLKFWSGAIVGIILMIAGLFSKNPSGKLTFKFFIKNNLLIFFIGGIIALGFGYLFTFIPTIASPWINAIAAPVIQFVFLDLLLSTSKKQKQMP